MRFAGLLVAALLLPQAALACECRDLTGEEATRQAALIFAGDTMETMPDGKVKYHDRFHMKGYILFYPLIANNRPDGDPSCAAKPVKGEAVLMLAYGNNLTGYYTDICAQKRTATYAQKQEITGILGPSYQTAKGYLDLLKVHPESLATARKLAAHYLAMRDGELAFGQYEYAAYISMNEIEDLLGQGEALLQIGAYRADEAGTMFERVLRKEKGNKQALSGRNRALAMLERWNDLPKKDVDLHNLSLENVAFGANISNLSLENAWLDGVDFTRAKLDRVNLTAARLFAPKFGEAILTGANFTRAKVDGGDFAKANLAESQFDFARLKNVKFTGTNLKGADFTGALLENVDFTGADLTGAKTDDLTATKVKWPRGYKPGK